MGLLEEFARQYGEQADEEEERGPEQEVGDQIGDEEIDDELREAEKRLAKAAYYKQIVKDGIVNEDGTSEASEINAEVRLWARREMVRLLKGGGADVPVAPTIFPFTDEEVATLKAIVAKLRTGRPAAPPEPTVRTIQAAPPPPAPPKVKTIKTSAAPPPAPKKKPPQGAPPSKPAQTARPQPKAPAADGKKEKVVRVRRDAEGKPYPPYDEIPLDITFKDLDGQLYRFIPHPSEDNTRVKRKISTQVRSPDSIPMPSREAMEAISASQSTSTLNTGVSASATSPFGQDNAGTSNHFVAAAAGSMKE
jgi:hypothetical protein